MLRKIAIALIFIFIGLFLVSLVKQISEALNSSQRLDSAVEEVTDLQAQNKELQNKLADVSKYDFLEEIARNKLNLAKEGETIVIIDEQAINQTIAQNSPKPEPPKYENWQKWLKLFGLM